MEPRVGSEDKPHTILPMSMHYQFERIDWRMYPRELASLDMTLRRGTERKCLRFFRPSKVFIDVEFDQSHSGLVIRDISGRGWDDVRVQVLVDDAHGGLGFFASDVVEVQCPPESNVPGARG